MASKRKAKSSTVGAHERKLAVTVRKSAQEIWYAGLGVFSTTRDEGGKVFEALVKEGKRVEATARKLAKSQFAQVRGQFTRATTIATKRATATWGKVERNLGKRVTAVKARVKELRGAKKRTATRRKHS